MPEINFREIAKAVGFKFILLKRRYKDEKVSMEERIEIGYDLYFEKINPNSRKKITTVYFLPIEKAHDPKVIEYITKHLKEFEFNTTL